MVETHGCSGSVNESDFEQKGFSRSPQALLAVEAAAVEAVVVVAPLRSQQSRHSHRHLPKL
jgi:hypothetical protein